jgi:protein-S-isoprenylcysteine O-methyltransferase Ste14
MHDLALSLPRFAFPAAVLAALFLALAVPAIRLRVRAGTWGIVFHRDADPFQRLVGATLVVCLAAVVTGAVLHAAFGPEKLGVWSAPAWVGALGWALVAASLLLTVTAQAQMGASWRVGIDDRKTELVTRGLFRVVRNPIFSAMLLMLGGAALVAPCAWSIALWLGSALVLSLQTRLEERHLAGLHGQRYLEYASRVGRFVPGLGTLQSRDVRDAVSAERARGDRRRAA